MSDVQQFHQQIQGMLRNLNNLINRSPLYSTNKKKWRDQCNSVIHDANQYIQTCQQLISDMPAASVKHLGKKTKQLKRQLEQYKGDYERKMKEETASAPQATKQEADNGNVMAVIKRGDQTQDRINQALGSMQRTVEEGISLADQINIQLNKQIEQLDRIHGKVKDTESALKRAQKSINYFVKALECDKCMLGLILLNVLALIGLIVLLVKKNGG